MRKATGENPVETRLGKGFQLGSLLVHRKRVKHETGGKETNYKSDVESTP